MNFSIDYFLLTEYDIMEMNERIKVLCDILSKHYMMLVFSRDLVCCPLKMNLDCCQLCEAIKTSAHALHNY